MIAIKKTNSDDKDFQKLVSELDKDLATRDGSEHAFYSQFNKTTGLNTVMVAYDNDEPVGCGAIRNYKNDVMEVKRMYVVPGKRGQGIAKKILEELETWAVELNCNKTVLETGKKQPEAIALYSNNGYHIIPNYGQYENTENSVCFAKNLSIKPLV